MVQGLQQLCDLRVLNLAGNCIEHVKNLSGLSSLVELNLRRNRIQTAVSWPASFIYCARKCVLGCRLSVNRLNLLVTSYLSTSEALYTNLFTVIIAIILNIHPTKVAAKNTTMFFLKISHLSCNSDTNRK